MLPSFHQHYIDSPIGKLLAVTNDAQAVCALRFTEAVQQDAPPLPSLLSCLPHLSPGHPYPLVTSPAPACLGEALTAYFNGQYAALDKVPVQLHGTPFQQRVWSLLRTLPAGTTTTYSELAKRLGNANLARAVGAANAANPIALLIACHRVIGIDGKLTGYAWGINRKTWLLQHEKASLSSNTQP